MYLNRAYWQDFQRYLLIDKKLKTTKRNLNPLRSRYAIIQKFFTTKEFNRDNFNIFIQDKVLSGYKNTYINGFIKIAKHIDKWLKINEIQDYTYFREKDEEYEILTSEEIKALADCEIEYKRDRKFQTIRNRALIYFVSLTGCRIYEAIDLEWKDIRESPVPHAILRDTKNNEDRIVPLRSTLLGLLKDIPKRSTKVFDLKDDAHVSLDLKKRALACKITKRVWWHLFRHSYVTTMLSSGLDALIVAKIVGHKDPRSTQRYNQMNIMSLAMAMDMHPLCKDNQTIGLISSHLKDYIEKLLNKTIFKLCINESPEKLTITVENNYSKNET